VGSLLTDIVCQKELPLGDSPSGITYSSNDPLFLHSASAYFSLALLSDPRLPRCRLLREQSPYSLRVTSDRCLSFVESASVLKQTTKLSQICISALPADLTLFGALYKFERPLHTKLSLC
jgi:hypothetical protein